MNYERHKAIVVANNDSDNPNKRGEIKVACAGILGDEDTALPDWIPPVLDWGWFYVPDIGEIVEIELNTSDTTDEMPGQSSIDGMDLHWRGKRFFTGDSMEANNEVRQVNENFLTNYPKRRGFATPNGHVLYFDDKDGSQKIEIIWKKGSATQTIAIDDSGILVTDKNGSKIQMDGSGNVTITSTDFSAKTDTVNLVDGADQWIVRGDELLTWLNAHTHPTGMGPSGTPITPAIPADFLSTVAKVK